MSRITYEITATVVENLRESCESYMVDRHIPDLMATGAFAEASFARSEPGRYRIRYEALNRESLNAYLRDHATRLREHLMETFPDGIDVSREEWEVVAMFYGESSMR